MFAIEASRHGLGEVRLVDDVVSIEHRSSLPAAELHDLTLRHTVASEVPSRSATKIVDEATFEPRLLAGPIPSATEAPNALPVAMEYEQPVTPLSLLLKQLLQLRGEPEGKHAGVRQAAFGCSCSAA